MGASIAARVLRKTTIHDMEREPGSPLTIEEWNKIAPQVQDALVNSMIVRRVFGEESDATLKSLMARIEDVETVYAARLSGDLPESFSIKDRSLTKIPIEKLIVMRDRLKAEYKALTDAESVAAGTGNPNKFQVRF